MEFSESLLTMEGILVTETVEKVQEDGQKVQQVQETRHSIPDRFLPLLLQLELVLLCVLLLLLPASAFLPLSPVIRRQTASTVVWYQVKVLALSHRKIG